MIFSSFMAKHEGDQNSIGGHYSDKSGHLARSKFHRDFGEVSRLIGDELTSPLHAELRWLIRRNMPRHPKTGR